MKEDKKTNPYHRSYGLFSNMKFTLQGMVHSDRQLRWLIPMVVICEPVTRYLWSFVAKWILDLLTVGGDGSRLWLMVVLGALVQMVASSCVAYGTGDMEWRFIHGRMCMMIANNVKTMEIDFEHLEDPDVMDCHRKAGNAVGSNWVGLEGMMHDLMRFLKAMGVVALGLVILGRMDGKILGIMTVLALLSFVFKDRVNARNKEKYEDPLAPWYRKAWYLTTTARDFSAAKDIRMYGLREWLLQWYDRTYQKVIQSKIIQAKWRFLSDVVSHVLWMAAQCLVYVWLIDSIIKGRFTIGQFTLYLSAAATFFENVSAMFLSLSELYRRSREVDDFRSFQNFDGGDQRTEGIPVPSMEQYEFVFENVSFRYPKAEKDALSHLNLTIRAGERLAVVGLNGAGKSTMIKLLLRLYEPSEGRILLNGVDIRSYEKKSYYGIFAPVFQEVNLFAFPMAENVSMKSPTETDRQRAIHALAQAGLEDKLQSLPKGVDTELLKVIYDDGVDLSGGEKQKLALARALYKEAPVVILDEPTAALDALAERRLYQEFDQLIGGKTAVYISHRLSSTQFCSHVAMFRQGEMVEYGTHESLMARGGAYAEMFRLQAQYYVEGKEAG